MREFNDEDARAILMLRMGIHKASRIIRNGGTWQDFDIVSVLLAEDDPIRGNRKQGTAMNWSDVSLCFAATLRNCLEILEEK